jgi:hypothetical protein
MVNQADPFRDTWLFAGMSFDNLTRKFFLTPSSTLGENHEEGSKNCIDDRGSVRCRFSISSRFVVA